MGENVLLVGLCVLARCRRWKCTFQTVEHHGPLSVSRCRGVKKGGMMTSKSRRDDGWKWKAQERAGREQGMRKAQEAYQFAN